MATAPSTAASAPSSDAAAPSSTPEGPEQSAQLLAAWSTSLGARDQVWAELQAEKEAGWSSAAVEWHWRQRDKSFLGKVDRTGRRGMVPSTAKYVKFYREWMPRLEPALFKRPAGSDGHPHRFADLGSSPGGMSEYLVADLGWEGHAFSLGTDDAGFGMMFQHPSLRFTDADLAVDGAWRELLKGVGEASLDFVNGGVVIDRGQQRNELPGRHEEKRESGTCDRPTDKQQQARVTPVARCHASSLLSRQSRPSRGTHLLRRQPHSPRGTHRHLSPLSPGRCRWL